ncbi:hypothetical protein GWI33_021052 [Rhynchophorus ferrugineus]|uniref:Uncharacterized protein n=1 Tax=Rhynchophorus ferrugineus TaxID=354439 RepID=A0A834HNF4_RHYFE|nr:hypothetical protein GWI33_021052 [Rhynchophorus ferrugineus]
MELDKRSVDDMCGTADRLHAKGARKKRQSKIRRRPKSANIKVGVRNGTIGLCAGWEWKETMPVTRGVLSLPTYDSLSGFFCSNVALYFRC